MNVTFVWIAGLRNIADNETADELSRKQSCRNESSEEVVRNSINSVKMNINLHFLEEANSRWRKTKTCKVTRKTWPENRNRNNRKINGSSTTKCCQAGHLLQQLCGSLAEISAAAKFKKTRNYHLLYILLSQQRY